MARLAQILSALILLGLAWPAWACEPIVTQSTTGCIAWIAVDNDDLKTRETGLTGTQLDLYVRKSGDTGTSTSVGASSLTDSSKSWTTNQWATNILRDSAGTTFTINSNTATVLTLASGTPASGEYAIERPFTLISPDPRIRHTGNGVYEAYFSTSHTDTLGDVVFDVRDTGGTRTTPDVSVKVYVAPRTLQAGLSNLDAAISTRSTLAVDDNIGINWGDITNPTTAQNLSATNIDVDQAVASVSGAVTLPTIPANWITAAGTHPDFSPEVSTAVWEELTATARTAGTYGQLFKDKVAPMTYTVANELNVNTRYWAGSATATDDIALLATLAKTTHLTGFNDITALSVWHEPAANVVTASTIGLQLKTNIDGTIASRAPSSTALSNVTWTDTKAGYLDTNIGSRLATTGYTAPLSAAQTESEANDALVALNLDHLVGTATGIPALPAGTYLDLRTLTSGSYATATALATVNTDTDDIQTRLPAALTAGGNMKSDALALSSDTTAADNLEAAYDGTGYAGSWIAVTISTGNLDTWDTIAIDETTVITAAGDHKGKSLLCGKVARVIVATANEADTITVTPGNPFPTAPAAASVCYIVRP